MTKAQLESLRTDNEMAWAYWNGKALRQAELGNARCAAEARATADKHMAAIKHYQHLIQSDEIPPADG